MNITIIAVGKIKNKPESILFEEYAKRMSGKIEVKELEDKIDHKFIPKGSFVVALDENGKQFSSRDFAKFIEEKQNNGISHFTFLIGGADGHDESTKSKADLLLSFGKLTLPHMMARAILAEQIYRAQSIISGHPYHRQ